MEEQIQKIIIIGAGPAGYTAAIYAGRANLQPVIYAGPMPGGLLTQTGTVENYPGFPEGIDGYTLMDQMEQQAKQYGATIKYATVTNIEKEGDLFKLTLQDNSIQKCETLIMAAGASPRWLGLESEQRLRTHGVSACAHCDGPFFKNKTVCVIGGGDSAMEEATAMTKFANVVYLIHRKETFRASSIMQERVKANPKIQCRMACVTEEILGADHVEGIRIKDLKSGQTEIIPCDGVFVALGHVPNTDILRNIMTLDDHGYPVKSTAPAGLFFAGDCADPEYRQAITATSSGCQAAMDAEKYLNNHTRNF